MVAMADAGSRAGHGSGSDQQRSSSPSGAGYPVTDIRAQLNQCATAMMQIVENMNVNLNRAVDPGEF